MITCITSMIVILLRGIHRQNREMREIERIMRALEYYDYKSE